MAGKNATIKRIAIPIWINGLAQVLSRMGEKLLDSHFKGHCFVSKISLLSFLLHLMCLATTEEIGNHPCSARFFWNKM